MPLIPQQKIVTVTVAGGGEAKAIEELENTLADWPPLRIIAITSRGVANPLGRGELGVALTAVVETI